MKDFFTAPATKTWAQRVATFAAGVAAGVYLVPIVVAKLHKPAE